MYLFVFVFMCDGIDACLYLCVFVSKCVCILVSMYTHKDTMLGKIQQKSNFADNHK